MKTVRFVNEPLFSRLVAKGPKPWDFAIAAITITEPRQANVGFTAPYMVADQGVLARRASAPCRPRSPRSRSCSSAASARRRARSYIVSTIKPVKKPQLAKTPTALFDLLRSERCDAAVYDAPILAAEQQAAPDRYGEFAGVIATGERYGIAGRRAARSGR